MVQKFSCRNLLKTSSVIGATVSGIGVLANPPRAQSQPSTAGNEAFFRDDWFGEPWRKPEALVLL